jgi:hypothetical protein
MGVRNTWPAIVRRAASMSATVTLMCLLSRPRAAPSRMAQMPVPLAPGPSILHLPVAQR